MLKGEDIVLLLKLTHTDSEWTVRSLELETTIPRSVVQRSLKRLSEAGLFDAKRRLPRVSQSEEFLIHGLKYVFPAAVGGETRGVATAWGAEPLVSLLAPRQDDLTPVWSSPEGTTRGLAIAPLHVYAVEAAKRDPLLREELALIDGLRIGDARIRGLAAELLSKRLVKTSA
jgi:hypothetical protein